MANHPYNVEHTDKLRSEDRQEILPVEQILEKMELRKHDVVADLGAGSRFYNNCFGIERQRIRYEGQNGLSDKNIVVCKVGTVLMLCLFMAKIVCCAILFRLNKAIEYQKNDVH